MEGIYPSQIIVKTATRETGQYGLKLKLTDMNGKPFSISEKHKDLWPIFENNIGKTITLTWNIPPAGVTWKAFISKAEAQTVAADPPPPIPSATTPPVQPQQPLKAPIPPTVDRDTLISAQVAFKGAIELISNKALPLDSHIGLKAQAWMIEKLDADLSVASKALIEQKLASMKEAAKPKKVEGK